MDNNRETTINSDDIILESNNPELFETILNRLNQKCEDDNNGDRIKRHIILDPLTGKPTKEHVKRSIKQRLINAELEKERVEKERLDQLEKERLYQLEKERMEKEKLEKERLDHLEKERLEKAQAIEQIILHLELACENGTFKKLEENYNIWSQILVLRNNNQSTLNKGNALEFLLKAVKVANKRGAFELEQSYKLATWFNLFIM
jgi:hypothetical protein